jgi:hypothetical protein
MAMFYRSLIGAIALVAVPCVTIVDARGLDEAKYPDLKGQWIRSEGARGVGRFDPTKPPGRLQEAPLTPEYQAIFEASLRDQAKGGQGNNYQAACVLSGMPRIMGLAGPMEILVQQIHTLMIFQNALPRRIYTDGRDWPKTGEPSFQGYSIGKWIDQDGDGRYDMLEIETRHLRGPRAYDPSGLPFHDDNATAVKERMYLDKANRNIMHNEMTVTDNALTRPWSVHKKYQRDPKEVRPLWLEDICNEGQALVRVGTERYFLSGDGYLMPVKKGQAPPRTGRLANAFARFPEQRKASRNGT